MSEQKVVLVVSHIKEAEISVSPTSTTNLIVSNDTTKVLQMTPVGPQGIAGPTGPTGPQGEKGDPGNFFGIENINGLTGDINIVGADNQIEIVSSLSTITIGINNIYGGQY